MMNYMTELLLPTKAHEAMEVCRRGGVANEKAYREFTKTGRRNFFISVGLLVLLGGAHHYFWLFLLPLCPIFTRWERSLTYKSQYEPYINGVLSNVEITRAWDYWGNRTVSCISSNDKQRLYKMYIPLDPTSEQAKLFTKMTELEAFCFNKYCMPNTPKYMDEFSFRMIP